MVKIEINFNSCTGCGTCVDTCPVGVYQIDETIGKTKIIAIKECLDCKACEVQCPEECIEVISED
ncbi:MAG: 4Fe-4S dicluster domain-containing protein [Candidatus Helarchaeota archaeon]